VVRTAGVFIKYSIENLPGRGRQETKRASHHAFNSAENSFATFERWKPQRVEKEQFYKKRSFIIPVLCPLDSGGKIHCCKYCVALQLKPSAYVAASFKNKKGLLGQLEQLGHE
jgi:hypothetical protein